MNKIVKIVIGILIVILVIWGIIFAIDYTRCSNMKQPIFVVLKKSTGSSLKLEEYQGLAYRVEIERNVTKGNEEQITKIEMYILDKFVAGCISDISGSMNEATKSERIVMVNGKLYYDTGRESTIKARCGVMDGKITSNIDSDKVPSKDGESNFKGKYDYQYGIKDTIEINIEDKWYVFEQRNVNI